jgi:hypothetical protein
VKGASDEFRVANLLIRAPRKDRPAFGIPCEEWNALKQKTRSLDYKPNLCMFFGSLALGFFGSATLSTLLGATGSQWFEGPMQTWPMAAFVFPLICVVALIIGSVLVTLGIQEDRVRKKDSQHLGELFEFVERTYNPDWSTIAPSPESL